MPWYIWPLYIFVLLFCIGLVVFAIIMLVQNLFNIPPYMPSFNRRIRTVLSEILSESAAKHPKKTLKLIDLGSGDGKIAFLAAKLGYEASGIEINPFLIATTRFRTKLAKHKPQFHFGSYFNHNLSGYDVVFTYLFPETMEELEEKIFKEMKPGSIVVSNTFKFKHHKGIDKGNRIWVYEVK